MILPGGRPRSCFSKGGKVGCRRQHPESPCQDRHVDLSLSERYGRHSAPLGQHGSRLQNDGAASYVELGGLRALLLAVDARFEARRPVMAPSVESRKTAAKGICSTSR